MPTMLAIARNTLSETIRQNVFCLLLAAASLLILCSPFFAMFTFMDSRRLVSDMGLVTILLTGLFLAGLSAANVVGREIEGRTALSVLSKPISRESFLAGKFLGLAAAVGVATYLQTLVLLLTFRIGVKDTAGTHLDWSALGSLGAAVLLALLAGAFLNYFFQRPFLSVAVWSFTATLSLAALAFCFFSFDSNSGEYAACAFGAGLNLSLLPAALLTYEALLVLVAVAVAASTRVKAPATLAVLAAVFFAGMLSDYLFGPALATSATARLAYAIIPDMQLFWINEAMVEGKHVPALFLGQSAGYAALYILAVLCVAMALFNRREVRE